jgi:replicative DNA helicase
LSFFLAPTGVGKTVSLITLAKTAIFHHKKVLFISAELSQYETLKRFDAAMSGIAKRDIRSQASYVRDNILKSVQFSKAMEHLRVIEVPMGTATVKDMEYVVKQLHKRNWPPDLIIVDYADHLLPARAFPGAPRLEVYSVYRDLRSLAQKYNAAVWTASQTNDAGTHASESETENLSVRHASESKGKTHLADLILGLAMTDKEKEAGLARIVMLKNRFGQLKPLPYQIYPDLDHSLMWKADYTPILGERAKVNFGASPDDPQGARQAQAIIRELDEMSDAEKILDASTL